MGIPASGNTCEWEYGELASQSGCVGEPCRHLPASLLLLPNHPAAPATARLDREDLLERARNYEARQMLARAAAHMSSEVEGGGGLLAVLYCTGMLLGCV